VLGQVVLPDEGLLAVGARQQLLAVAVGHVLLQGLLVVVPPAADLEKARKNFPLCNPTRSQSYDFRCGRLERFHSKRNNFISKRTKILVAL
jgi:hypothetical protein